ncbi:MAG: dephospho-CoA kinase [Rhodospirillaceae bacterium]|nr:dephospho-CoA kinase [Rhodospirillaceae bacterium]|tara:strand:- start:1447 stop:2037 length:591 start_codon:yes stop_codon:yes gene_type:complete
MIVLGVTGSIAMGKSTVSTMLSRMNNPMHDADKTVHNLMKVNGKAYYEIAKRFPRAIETNSVDRTRLGQEVFGNPEKLKELENILHPLVREARDNFIRQQYRYRSRLAILDVPLLYETGGDKHCHKVLVVSAPYFIQRQRVLARQGMTQTKFHDILKRQLPDYEKRKRADFIVPTGLGKAYTYKALKRLMRSLSEI